MYRHIINAYKHGKEENYIYIKEKYSDILNNLNTNDTLQTVFIFNLEKVAFNALYRNFETLLNIFSY